MSGPIPVVALCLLLPFRPLEQGSRQGCCHEPVSAHTCVVQVKLHGAPSDLQFFQHRPSNDPGAQGSDATISSIMASRRSLSRFRCGPCRSAIRSIIDWRNKERQERIHCRCFRSSPRLSRMKCESGVLREGFAAQHYILAVVAGWAAAKSNGPAL